MKRPNKFQFQPMNPLKVNLLSITVGDFLVCCPPGGGGGGAWGDFWGVSPK